MSLSTKQGNPIKQAEAQFSPKVPKKPPHDADDVATMAFDQLPEHPARRYLRDRVEVQVAGPGSRDR